MLDLLEKSDFEPLLNQTLNIRFSPEVTLPATLIQVQELKGETPAKRQPFSITLFTEQRNEYYQQGIFVLQHPEKGELSLFLVPLEAGGAGAKYEAVFS